MVFYFCASLLRVSLLDISLFSGVTTIRWLSSQQHIYVCTPHCWNYMCSTIRFAECSNQLAPSRKGGFIIRGTYAPLMIVHNRSYKVTVSLRNFEFRNDTQCVLAKFRNDSFFKTVVVGLE